MFIFCILLQPGTSAHALIAPHFPWHASFSECLASFLSSCSPQQTCIPFKLLTIHDKASLPSDQWPAKLSQQLHHPWMSSIGLIDLN